MSTTAQPQADTLHDFEARSITLNSTTKLVHIAGTGPAVIVMAEMPGISPQVARFARWVRDAGFTVYMPSLFGALMARCLALKKGWLSFAAPA